MAEPVRLTTDDGFSLAGNLHPARGEAKAFVVINSAMGVEQGFYSGFAAHLAEKGFDALTWDYRGIAQSRPAPVEPFGILTWAERDIEAALKWAFQRNEKVMVVGHSLGTQLLGFAESADKVSAVVGVGSQSGDWRNWPLPAAVGMAALSWVLLPGISTAFGRLPKGLMGEEIPKGPIQDWARWIRSPGYLLSEGERVPKLFGRLTCPITGVSVDDDRYAPKRAVDALYAIYSRARVERLHLVPRQLGLKQLGHFGPFRRQVRDAVWPLLTRPLENAAEPFARAG